jgi:hypothetical protein
VEKPLIKITEIVAFMQRLGTIEMRNQEREAGEGRRAHRQRVSEDRVRHRACGPTASACSSPHSGRDDTKRRVSMTSWATSFEADTRVV